MNSQKIALLRGGRTRTSACHVFDGRKIRLSVVLSESRMTSESRNRGSWTCCCRQSATTINDTTHSTNSHDDQRSEQQNDQRRINVIPVCCGIVFLTSNAALPGVCDNKISMKVSRIQSFVLSLAGVCITVGLCGSSHGFASDRRGRNAVTNLPLCSPPPFVMDSDSPFSRSYPCPSQKLDYSHSKFQSADRLVDTSLFSSSRNSNDGSKEIRTPAPPTPNWGSFALFSSVGVLYWYIMVFGAAAQANGLPVPDFVPMSPGWPASDADFVPVIEDSYHFFYLSELLHNEDAPYVIPPRLAVFNLVEAWIFAMLPALWKDTQRRLPRPILLGSWLLLGINLTNAFLAPYLAITELRWLAEEGESNNNESSSSSSQNPRPFLSKAFPRVFGAIASTVVGYALYQSTIVATSADWSEFGTLVQTDRSYLAFCVDPVFFALFQPLILARVKNTLNTIDYIPFVGLIAWLFSTEEEKD